MLTTSPKCLAHVRTSKHIRSFRSCSTPTEVSLARLEMRRIAYEEEKRAVRNAQRLRRAAEWSKR